MTAANPYEMANRLKKAVAISDCLSAAGISAEDAAGMTPQQFKLAAAAAEVREPSQITCQLVVLMLARREAARKIFAGRTLHAAAA